MDKTTVFLVDDHQLFREGLKLLLSNISFIGDVFEASNGQEFLDALETVLPDIIFMDIEMPVLNGIETTKTAIERYPDIRIIALSMYGDEQYFTKMINAGVKGFILKNSGIQEVENAIMYVLSDKTYFSQEIVAALVQSHSRKKKLSRSSELSKREVEVLFNICKGYSNQEIADMLFISKRTVDKHRENLLFKTRSKNTAGLVMYAIQSGIIEV